MAAVVCLLAVAAGIVAAFLWIGRLADEPRWSWMALRAGVGAAAGIAATSSLFSLRVLIAPGASWLSPAIELAVVGAALFFGWRHTRHSERTAALRRDRATPWLLLAMFAAALVFAGAAFDELTNANPQGNWDAWAVWNLRARFLAAPDAAAQLAYSPRLAAAHPGYPMLVPGFIARCWSYSGGAPDPLVPALTAAAFFAALLSIAAGSFALLRGERLALVFGLCLAANPALVREAASQYADVPLACFQLASLALLLVGLGRRPSAPWLALAGAFASCAAWTKNEGLLFFAVFAALALFRLRHERGRIAVLLMGSLPVGLLAVAFKLCVAPRDAPPLALASLAEPGRVALVARGLIREVGAMGSGLYHPALPLAALALTLGFGRRGQPRDRLLPATVAAALTAGDLAVYLLNRNDLAWLIGSSLGRVLVQIWPCFLLTFFLALRDAPAPATPPSPARHAKRVKGMRGA